MEVPSLRSTSPAWRAPPSQMTQADRHHAEGLPAPNYIDLGPVKRDGGGGGGDGEYDHRHSVSTAAGTPVASLVGPAAIYSGPPPPYSFCYPPSTLGPVPGIAGYYSPPDSRRALGDDKETQQRSLPSIHEALAKTQALYYAPVPPQPAPTSLPTSITLPGPAPPPPSTIPPPVQTPVQGPTATSVPPPPLPPPPLPPTSGSHAPTVPATRSHPQSAVSGPPNPYAAVQSSPVYGADRFHQKPYPSTHDGPARDEPTLPSLRSTLPEPSSSTHTSSPVSPSGQHRSSPRVPSAQYPAAMYPSGPPRPIFQPYQPAYSFPPPSTGTLAYEHHFVAQQPWRSDGSELDKVEEMRKAASKRSPGRGQHYGESVKRHLDIFDLETSLNEMAEGSGRALAFSRHFGARAQQSSRSGPSACSMPSLAECDDMIQRQNRVLDALARIREIIVTQKRAVEEQRSRDEASKAQRDFAEDASAYTADKTEGGGGFAGADPKKRRGRNAPPGRCHSCNRAETPEWRRGPDGARTLCNACGLHYAKLTRKMGANPTSVGGSNLRPKDAEPASP